MSTQGNRPPQDGGGGGQGGKPPQRRALDPRGLKKRTITLSMTVPTVITSIIGLVLTLLWVFFLGIILGRGHMPESSIPRLNSMMPQPVPTAPAQLVGAPATQPGQAPAGTNASAAPSRPTASRPQAQVMPQEDLDFQASLKPKPSVASTSAKRPQTKAEKAAAAKESAKKAEAAKQKAQKDAQKTEAAPGNQAEQFDYVFQLAAYKTPEQADALTTRLKKAGFKVSTVKSVEKGTTWYRNVLAFRGAPSDIDRLRANLQKHNITQLIRKEKKPVTP